MDYLSERGAGRPVCLCRRVSQISLGTHPLLTIKSRARVSVAQCETKTTFKFSSGRGAILAMDNAMITIIDPPGSLKRLLEDPTMRGVAIVSEVHSCSSYARLLTTGRGGTIALGLRVEPSGVASVGAAATWVQNATSGNFKSHVNKSGERSFYPLYCLVTLSEEGTSTGIEAVERV